MWVVRHAQKMGVRRVFPTHSDVRADPVPDERVRGKIKWYIKPLLFGGEPGMSDNVKWVELDQHAQLVRFWNQKYREIRLGSQSERRREGSAMSPQFLDRGKPG